MLLGVKVAEHVGTKGKEACIRQFLCLPIEDRILDAKLDEGADAAWESSHVMSQIAYLCEDMPPATAQEATQAALQALVKAKGKEVGADGADASPVPGGKDSEMLKRASNVLSPSLNRYYYVTLTLPQWRFVCYSLPTLV